MINSNSNPNPRVQRTVPLVGSAALLMFSKNPQMNLRPATTSDQAALFDLHVELFRKHIEEIWGWNDEWQIANFLKEWAEVRTEILTQGGDVLGYIQTRPEAEHIYVLNLALHPRCQCLGFGSMAMEVLKERARLRGLSIKLSVFRTNQRVIAFYNRLGFEIEAETKTGLMMHWRDDAPRKNKSGEEAATEQSHQPLSFDDLP